MIVPSPIQKAYICAAGVRYPSVFYWQCRAAAALLKEFGQLEGIGPIAAAAAAFVGTHFLLSYPLRKPIVNTVGSAAFLGIYSVVAAATLGLALAYRAAPAGTPLWPVGDGLLAAATVVICWRQSCRWARSLATRRFPIPVSNPGARRSARREKRLRGAMESPALSGSRFGLARNV